MKKALRRAIQKIVRRAGFDLVRYNKSELGEDPFSDMRYFLKSIPSPTIFDVGANVGQTVNRLNMEYPKANIHSFEPSPSTFEQLKETCSKYNNSTPWNYGVGASNGTLEFIENDSSVMSSFLAPSKDSWSKAVKKTEVQVVTLDSFAQEQGIDYIHILKSDTQGYDFEVFKGAGRLMDEDKIALLYFEFIFSEMYENLPSFDEVYRHLVDKGFSLVAIYDFNFHNDAASWSDALFINDKFFKDRAAK